MKSFVIIQSGGRYRCPVQLVKRAIGSLTRLPEVLAEVLLGAKLVRQLARGDVLHLDHLVRF